MLKKKNNSHKGIFTRHQSNMETGGLVTLLTYSYEIEMYKKKNIYCFQKE